jgi:hypothetical protein
MKPLISCTRLSHGWVTIDVVWIDNKIYWTLIKQPINTLALAWAVHSSSCLYWHHNSGCQQTYHNTLRVSIRNNVHAFLLHWMKLTLHPFTSAFQMLKTKVSTNFSLNTYNYWNYSQLPCYKQQVIHIVGLLLSTSISSNSLLVVSTLWYTPWNKYQLSYKTLC